jgi:hypothetical protein
MAESKDGKSLALQEDRRIVGAVVVQQPSGLRAYPGRFMKTFLGKRLWEFGKGAVLNIVTAVATVGFSVYLGTTSGGAIKGNFLAMAGTYTMIVAVFLIGHTICTASQVYTEDQVEIQRLRERVILSKLQTEILNISRDMRSFMAEHQDYPVEPTNPTTAEFEEWNNRLSAWITKFRAKHEERLPIGSKK